jgi:hypothetical protein
VGWLTKSARGRGGADRALREVQGALQRQQLLGLSQASDVGVPDKLLQLPPPQAEEPEEATAAAAEVVRRVASWAAFEQAAGGGVCMEVCQKGRPDKHGLVMKVDGHRVRVDFGPSGGRCSWKTKRELDIILFATASS